MSAEERRMQNLRNTTPRSATNNLGSGIYGTRPTNSLTPPRLSGISGGYRPDQVQTQTTINPVPTRAPSTGSTGMPGMDMGGGGGGGASDNWRDSAYNSQIAALQAALQRFETGAQTRAGDYSQDYMTGLSRMGYRPATGFQALPTSIEDLAKINAESELPTVMGTGNWDIEGELGRTSSAARGTRGMRDEFAGRGNLRSSAFARNFGDFQTRLNQQLEAMEQGRTRFGRDLGTSIAEERASNEQQMQAARQAALLRAATRAAGG
jgi:hypothetical protein